MDLGRSNNPNTTPTKDYENVRVVVCLRSSREDVLRRGRGDRCLDSSYSLGSVKAGIELTGTEAVILHLEIGAAKGQGGS